MTLEVLVQAAVRAYRAGEWTDARARLEEIAATGRGDASAFALLATVYRRLGDDEAAEVTVDRALALEAQNLRAVLVKADLLAARGVLREANFYYGGAISIAGTSALPPDLAESLARAHAVREQLKNDMNARLSEELEAAGYDEGASDPRFKHALDLLTNKKQLYVQQPRGFYYPELPNRQFYPREEFPWLAAIEAETDAITRELANLLSDEANFAPYMRSSPDLPNRRDALIDSLDWSVNFLCEDGEETPSAPRCPRTMAALAQAPLCRIPGRSPQIMFSRLRAHAHIQPHTGYVNTRLICHLPLIVPPNCRFRVGNEVREWKRGEALVFDDTIEHEARNDSETTRVVLIFDIWRPELSEEERTLVSTLLHALDTYSGQSVRWE